MSYEIEEKTIEAQPTLSVRGSTTFQGIPGAIGDRTRKVWNRIQELGQEPVGPAFTRYHEIGDEVDLEVGYPVAEALKGKGEVEAGELPGGPVVATVHRGAYDDLPGAGQALDRWLEENDREARGPNWEVYRVDPGTVDDPSQLETDVVKPIR